MSTFLLVYGVPFDPIPSMFTPIYAAFITYAILKHQLMDIRIVFRRSVVYSVLIAIMTGTYLVAVVIIEKAFQGFFGYRSLLASGFVAFLIAVFFNPLRQGIQTVVDHALFKGTAAELANQREELLVEIRRGEQMKAVGTLAAGLAHEIKNPLASIKTFTEHLKDRGGEPDFRDKFQRIVGGEVERINLIVGQLLDFARPVPIRKEPLRVSVVLDETLELLNNELVSRHVNIVRRYQEDCDIVGDPQRLKQAFLNILLNSLQAMNGPARLEIDVVNYRKKVQVRIRDNGQGISEQELKRIRQPFYSTRARGTGLGLAIVDNIVKEHNGNLSIE